jgi:hypothetical protein
MSKSTRRGGAARAGFEYFDRRQMGPWVLLRPLFRSWRAALVTLSIVAILTITMHLNPYVMGGLVAVLFLGSLALVWQTLALLIRARAVLCVLALLVIGNVCLKSLFGDIAGNLLMLALLVGLLAFPPTWRFLFTRFWCVLDRQRVRACLKVCKVRTMNLDGALPFMMWARPTKTGERVWLWVRAGASGDDVEAALTYIAPACFARDARVHRVRKLSTVVAVEIIRRDPLSTGDSIPSPLSTLTELVKGKTKGEGTEAIRPSKVADVIATDPAASDSRKVRRTTTVPAEPATSPVVLVSGEDLSDYID